MISQVVVEQDICICSQLVKLPQICTLSSITTKKVMLWTKGSFAGKQEIFFVVVTGTKRKKKNMLGSLSKWLILHGGFWEFSLRSRVMFLMFQFSWPTKYSKGDALDVCSYCAPNAVSSDFSWFFLCTMCCFADCWQLAKQLIGEPFPWYVALVTDTAYSNAVNHIVILVPEPFYLHTPLMHVFIPGVSNLKCGAFSRSWLLNPSWIHGLAFGQTQLLLGLLACNDNLLSISI